jgi:hypothetical protein
MTPFARYRFLFLCLTPLFLAVPARAVDGVIEINQARALLGNVTPGDTAGFPVTIAAGSSGSYRLTGNLTVSSDAVDAIEVLAADVTLDLNGFTIDGPTVCTGFLPGPVICTPENATAAGIDARLAQGLRVTNGTIRNMPYAGVICDRRCQVVGVQAFENGRNGVAASSGSLITQSRAFHNGSFGFVSSGGLQNSWGSLFLGNVSVANGDAGISVALNDLIADNLVAGNGSDGIEGHTFLAARNVSSGNGGSGLSMLHGLAHGNACRSNTGHGFSTTSIGMVALHGNSFVGNTAGPIDGPPVQVGPNGCGGQVCP